VPNALRPVAKAVAPFVVSLVAVGLQWASTGTYDEAELATQLTGLFGALATYFVSNTPAA
jgi:hypothetical protein